ncbi:hypothetical protein PPROV_000857800 [Pycnococcus provasolii]|uniref:Uncharacterized protein n=1 Tax=Pycnococcus provasolii TaxID=41880 RepID=A0A830HT55_9CHLO|nr:hypothetical protein PPROV_000857800 [Pycnococcus provasolii]
MAAHCSGSCTGRLLRPTTPTLLLLLLALVLSLLVTYAVAQRRVPTVGDVDDIEDDEEDETFRSWGVHSANTPDRSARLTESKRGRTHTLREDPNGNVNMADQAFALFRQLEYAKTKDMDPESEEFQKDTLGDGSGGSASQICAVKLKDDPKRTTREAGSIAGVLKTLLVTAGAAKDSVIAQDKDTILINTVHSRLREIRKVALTYPGVKEFEHMGKVWVIDGEDDDGEPAYRRLPLEHQPDIPHGGDIYNDLVKDHERDKKRRKREAKAEAKRRRKEEKKRKRMAKSIEDGTFRMDDYEFPSMDMEQMIGTEQSGFLEDALSKKVRNQRDEL